MNDIAFIEKVDFSVDELDSSKSNLVIHFICQTRKDIVSWPNDKLPFYNTKILFSGVRALNIKFAGSGRIQVMGFVIDDVSRKGWESINYEVQDYENGVICFYCKTYEAKGLLEI